MAGETMKFYCKGCNAVVIPALPLVEAKEAYHKQEVYGDKENWPEATKITPSLGYTMLSVPEYYAYEELGSERKPVGVIRDYLVCHPYSFSEAIDITNKEQGCCNSDYYEVQCSCGEILGRGGDDCWQDGSCMLYLDKLNSEEV